MVAGQLVANPAFVVPVDGRGDVVLHLAEDDIVWPGFIDFHVHLKLNGVPGPGIDPVALPRMGVFGAADGGSYSWDHVPPDLQHAGIAVRRFVALLPEGLTQHPKAPRYQGLTDDVIERAQQCMATSSPPPVGLKIRLGQHDAFEDERLLRDAVWLARRLGLRVMVHLTGTFLPFDDVQAALDSGDVVTHIFHGRRGSILREGHLDPAVETARSRGIMFDVGHGANHFSWRVFRQSLVEGILPDTISTDMTAKTHHVLPVIDLAYVCSKFVDIAGIPWSQIYQATVATPSELLQMSPPSSVVLLTCRDGDVSFSDAEGEVVRGKRFWQPEVVIDRNRVIRNDRVTERG